MGRITSDINTALREIELGWIHGIRPDIGSLLESTESKCHRLNHLSPDNKEERKALLRSILGSIGENFVIHSPFHCDFGFKIHIGDNFTSNYNFTVLDEAEVSIGNNVFIGPNVGIYTIAHALNATQRNEGIMTARKVTIGDNVWIGAGAIILPGVTIGRDCVVGAGSVVCHDITDGMLAVGNPCRPLRKINDNDRVEPIN